MSFRAKLSLFFVVIVMVPMIVVGVLVVQITEDSRDGKADARVAAGLETASALYDAALKRAPVEAERIAEEAGLALAAGDEAALAGLAQSVLSEQVVSVSIKDSGGEVIAAAGSDAGLAAAETEVRTADGPVGSVRVATLRAEAFVARVRGLTAREVALVGPDGVLASTTPLNGIEVPDEASEEGVTLTLGQPAQEFRAAALALRGGPRGARLVLFVPRESGFVASQPLVAAVLALFLGIAFVLIALLLRNLQRRVAAMLAAARRIGEGNFEGEVPVEGNDEMAGLALEFNKMSDRLSKQMSQLQRQRRELDESVQRIGEAFASGLDRHALLEIMLETATSACAAEGGRVVLHDVPEEPGILASAELPKSMIPALLAADSAASDGRGAGQVAEGGHHAIGHAMVDRTGSGAVLCTLSVARTGSPFSDDEREVLRYLIGQTQISIENVGLHEQVAAQAVTDDLTGIANHRHFSEWLEREVVRVERFGGELSLVLIDVDNFKAVNDTCGHLQGDRVLRAIGATLRRQSRETDESARYGGEEFVLALAETDATGAIEIAERLRREIEGTEVKGEGGTAPVSVTASLGIATMPADGRDARTLIAAADAALYQAKRSGKNRVVSTARDAVPVEGIRGARRS